VTRVGTVLSLPGAPLGELAGSALDVAWIDLEHGALGVRDAQDLAVGLAATGCEAHVRLPRWDSELLPAVLDAGVDGIVVPRAEDPGDVARLVRRLHYPAAGTRGFGPRRAGAYGRRAAWWAAPDAAPVCTVQIETPAGVEAAGEIAAVPGVDALVVGLSDLSLELGVPQELADPAVRDAVAAVRTAAHAAGVRFGLAGGGEPAALAALARDDDDLLIFSADVRIYSGAIDAAARAVVRALESSGAAA
jgi:4-hydroxy-2-oxoheptanedioate aldolase